MTAVFTQHFKPSRSGNGKSGDGDVRLASPVTRMSEVSPSCLRRMLRRKFALLFTHLPVYLLILLGFPVYQDRPVGTSDHDL